MRRRAKHADEFSEQVVEPVQRLGSANLGDLWLRADDVLQIRKHVGDHATLGPQRDAEFVAKGAQALFALGQQGIYQILESFYESHIGRGSLKLVEFTAAEISAPRGNRLLKRIDQPRLARAAIAADEDEHTFAVRAAVEGVDERGCLRFPSIHARRQAKEHGIV